MEKMIHDQYKKNGTRNIYSSYNQMRAYVELLSKSITLLTFPSSNRQNFEDSRKVLAVSVSGFYQTKANVTLDDFQRYNVELKIVPVLHAIRLAEDNNLSNIIASF